MIDCIAGYHLNPWTCGIAKFNDILGRHLGVPVVGIRDLTPDTVRRPLLSIKISEFSPADAAELDAWSLAHTGEFELFLHAFDGTPVEQRLVAGAARVYCGNTELYRELRSARPRIQARRFDQGRMADRLQDIAEGHDFTPGAALNRGDWRSEW